MKNNQGVTLIELIVVILIISILAGGAVLGLRSLDSGNTRSTVDRIGSLIDYVRVLNMSKDKAYYLMLEESDGSYSARIYYVTQISGSRTEVNVLTEKLKLNNGKISYSLHNKSDDPDTEDAVNDIISPEVLRLSFNKASGSIETYDLASDIKLDAKDAKSIVITGGGRTITICLVTTTGKHYIE